MSKPGRKSLYETNVKSRFNDIECWAKNGATERQIAKNLGIGYSTFNEYKSKKLELKELLKKARLDIVTELRGALIKKALGYYYDEKKVITAYIKLPDYITHALKKAGIDFIETEKAELIKTEITTKRVVEDVAAINLALKNYDRENWSNDWQTYELRKREIDIRETQIKNNEW